MTAQDESHPPVVTRKYRLVVEVAAHIADMVDADLIDDIVPEAVRGSLANGAARVTSIGPVPEDARPWHARLAGMPIAGGVAVCVVPRNGNSAVVLVHEEQYWRYVTGIVFEHDFLDPGTGAPRLPRQYAYGAHFLYESEPGGTVDRAQETSRVLALMNLAARAAGADN